MPNPRITSIFNLHYETFDDSTVSFTHTKSEEILIREEAFVKNVEIVPHESEPIWNRINFGWLDKSPLAYVVVKNISIPPLDVNPTPEEIAELNSRIAFVQLGDQVTNNSGIQRILPNRVIILSPSSPGFEVWVSAKVPNVKLRVWAIPGNAE